MRPESLESPGSPPSPGSPGSDDKITPLLNGYIDIHVPEPTKNSRIDLPDHGDGGDRRFTLRLACE
jgi:hypothetical protein